MGKKTEFYALAQFAVTCGIGGHIMGPWVFVVAAVSIFTAFILVRYAG